jgi:hypothetical protein
MQSVPISTKIVSLNPTHGEVYSIQHNVIKFVSDLQQVSVFQMVLQFPPPVKPSATYNWNIVESDVKHSELNIYFEWLNDTIILQSY